MPLHSGSCGSLVADGGLQLDGSPSHGGQGESVAVGDDDHVADAPVELRRTHVVEVVGLSVEPEAEPGVRLGVVEDVVDGIVGGEAVIADLLLEDEGVGSQSVGHRHERVDVLAAHVDVVLYVDNHGVGAVRDEIEHGLLSIGMHVGLKVAGPVVHEDVDPGVASIELPIVVVPSRRKVFEGGLEQDTGIRCGQDCECRRENPNVHDSMTPLRAVPAAPIESETGSPTLVRTSFFGSFHALD